MTNNSGSQHSAEADGAATIERGATVELTIDRMAHGDSGIATAGDGRVVFVRGAFPGDRVQARITKVKKSLAFAEMTSVESAGPYRQDPMCLAAQAGAGCCDFDAVALAEEGHLKATVVEDQLRRVAKLERVPDIEVVDLPPQRGWRTRVRLGVDSQGRAGLRKRGSNELVTSAACAQLVPELVDGVVGPGARTFAPGAEVIVVMDASGQRHIVESMKASRGKRVEKIEKVIEGTGTVTEIADGITFEFPATAFWQAHVQAPQMYTDIVRDLLSMELDTESGQPELVGWDLYGGVGLFAPALAQSLSNQVLESDSQPKIITVDLSPTATAAQQKGLEAFDIEVVNRKVEEVAAQLPKPGAVVLDPPRTGAGSAVVSTVAQAGAPRVVHIGCDPATFARDVADWYAGGYEISRLLVVNAFPGTHHSETIALMTPQRAL